MILEPSQKPKRINLSAIEKKKTVSYIHSEDIHYGYLQYVDQVLRNYPKIFPIGLSLMGNWDC